jgi:hypothetical protein
VTRKLEPLLARLLKDENTFTYIEKGLPDLLKVGLGAYIRDEREVRMAAIEGWRGRFFEDFEVGDVYQHP